MTPADKDFALLLTIRRLRADRAARALAAAEARLAEAEQTRNAAQAALEQAKADLQRVNRETFRSTASRMRGDKLRQVLDQSQQMAAKVVDQTEACVTASGALAGAIQAVEASSRAFRQAETIVIKTETVLEALRDGDAS